MERTKGEVSKREVLIDRRRELIQAMNGDVVSVLAIPVEGEARQIAAVRVEQLGQQVARIDTALERVEQGMYGKCEGCGKPIPRARLDALPDATLCIKCARKAEQEAPVGQP